MGYTNVPTLNLQDLNDWNWLKQFWFAVKELQAIVAGGNGSGVFTWPPPNVIYSSGMVNSATDNGDGTLTFGMSAGSEWATDPSSGCSSPRWVNYTCPSELCYLAQNYDLIIEGDNTDPYTVVRGTITAQTYTAPAVVPTPSSSSGCTWPPPAPIGTGTLTVNDTLIKNAITGKFIPSLSYLVGKTYYILKQGGLWSTDRWLTKPSQPEEWKGTVDSGSIDGGGNGQLTNITNLYNPDPYNQPNPLINWGANKWGVAGISSSSGGSGHECMVYTADGYLHRLPIISNNSNTLFFGRLPSSSSSSSGPSMSSSSGMSSSSSSSSTSPLTLTGKYSIVQAGKVCDPNRQSGYPFLFYGGLSESFVSHNEDDTIGTTPLPAYSATWDEGTQDTGCNPTEHNCLDVDCYKENDNNCLCGDADTYLAPQYFAALRPLQLALMGLAPQFVPVATYTGTNVIPYYTLAKAFYDASINAWTSTASFVDASNLNMGVGQAPPYYPYQVYWTIVKDDCLGNDTSKSGTGTLLNSSTLQSVGSFDSTDNGKPMFLSYGYTRYIPRQFRYLYGKTCFIPDCDGSGCTDPPSVVDFSDSGCLGVGMYVYRDQSNNYSEYANGFVGETQPFQVGDIARYDGDNANDPFSGTGATTTVTPSTPYWDHFYRGKGKKGNYFARLAKLAGSATSGTNFSLTDSSKHWWTDQNGSGVLRTDSGTATGGSATTLVDSSKTSGAAACFWQSSRFNGAAFPWQGFYLEIFKGGISSSSSGMSSSSSGSPTATFKVPITGCDPLTGTLSFTAVAGLSVAAGDGYAIKEPGSYEPNTFAGRWLKVTLRGGSSSSSGGSPLILITGNDDDTLYFAPQAAVVPTGAAYQIIEFGTGTTWEYANTAPTDGRNYVPVIITTGGGSSSSSLATAYWVQPVGADGRSMPSTSSGGYTFKADQTANAPTIVKRYGVIEKGDYACKEWFDEMKRLKVLLKWTRGTFSWANKGEANWNAGLGGVIYYAEWGDGSDGGTFEYQQTSSDGFWPTERRICESGAEVSTLNTCPFATYIVFAYIESDPDTGTWGGTAFASAYAYAEVFAPSYYLNSSIDVDCFDYAPQECGTACSSSSAIFCSECYFDDQGTMANQNQYTNFYSTTVTTNNPCPYYSPQVGSNATPDYPPDFPSEADIKAEYAALGSGFGCQVQSGYNLCGPTVVIYKWDSVLSYV